MEFRPGMDSMMTKLKLPSLGFLASMLMMASMEDRSRLDMAGASGGAHGDWARKGADEMFCCSRSRFSTEMETGGTDGHGGAVGSS